MAKYEKAFGGYIADVPELVFIRCDGRAFHYDELSDASMTINQNTTDINGGWSLFPLATLPGSSTLEVSCTSAKFDTEMFSMTNATNYEVDADYEAIKTEKIKCADGTTLTLSETPVAGTISIGALKLTDDYTVAGSVITLKEAVEANTEVEVIYKVAKALPGAKFDNRAAAVGEAILRYPVYNSGEDCTTSGIIGYAIVDIYKARVTSQPTMAGSYKSASTFAFTISAQDAKRDDGNVYAMYYEKL